MKGLCWPHLDNASFEFGQCNTLEVRVPLPELHEYVYFGYHPLQLLSTEVLQAGKGEEVLAPPGLECSLGRTLRSVSTTRQTPTVPCRSTRTVSSPVSMTYHCITKYLTAVISSVGFYGINFPDAQNSNYQNYLQGNPGTPPTTTTTTATSTSTSTAPTVTVRMRPSLHLRSTKHVIGHPVRLYHRRGWSWRHYHSRSTIRSWQEGASFGARWPFDSRDWRHLRRFMGTIG